MFMARCTFVQSPDEAFDVWRAEAVPSILSRGTNTRVMDVVFCERGPGSRTALSSALPSKRARVARKDDDGTLDDHRDDVGAVSSRLAATTV